MVIWNRGQQTVLDLVLTFILQYFHFNKMVYALGTMMDTVPYWRMRKQTLYEETSLNLRKTKVE